MASKKELIQAAELLRDHCLSLPTCGSCPFYTPFNTPSCTCKIALGPAQWGNFRPPRWTLEDLGLAKSLKNCGADRLIKSLHCVYVIFEDDNPGTKPWRLPPTVFAALKPGTAITLDTIIEEADR